MEECIINTIQNEKSLSKLHSAKKNCTAIALGIQ